MKRTLAILAGIIVLSAVAAYAAWMTNINHHAQVRIPDGWNVEYKVIVKDDGKQAHMLLAMDQKETMLAAIVSMEIEGGIDLDAFKIFFENSVLSKPKVISEEKRGFNNLKGTLVIYEATFEGVPLKLMCFFTKKEPYLYAVFTGTTAAEFDAKKHFLDELLVTFQYLENP